MIHPIDTFRHMSFLPSVQQDVLMDHSIMNETYREKWVENLSKISLQ